MKKQNIVSLAAALWVAGVAGAAVQNEWNFETDSAGQTLDQANNTGADGALFLSADTAKVTQTDGAGGLVCSNDAAGEGGFWTDGAILTADVVDASSPDVRFLRYDVDYDMTSTNINSGTLLGLSFSDGGADTHWAGIALKCSVSGEMPPSEVTETVLEPKLELSGRVAVIAKVDLDAQEMSVWYDLSGGNNFNASDAPNKVVSNLELSSIDELEFRATGDLIAPEAGQSVVVDNIRTATTWEEISCPPADYGAAEPHLEVISFTDTKGGVMNPGETDRMTVIVKNTLKPATDLLSILTHSGTSSDFDIIPVKNTPVDVDENRWVTNTFDVVPKTDGVFTFSVEAGASNASNSQPQTLSLAVGKRISFEQYTVFNEVGGLYPGRVEPGETFDISITSINDGGQDVSNIQNSLILPSNGAFSGLTPITSASYGSLAVGASATTVYRVTCSPNTPNGEQELTVRNTADGQSWQTVIKVDVYSRADVSISDDEVTLQVSVNDTNSTSVSLVNAGNMKSDFSAAFDARVPVAYALTRADGNLQRFEDAAFQPNTVFETWTDENVSPVKDFGFDFKLYDEIYTSFSVSQKGFLILSSTNNVKLEAELDVFKYGSVDPRSVRFLQSNDELVVAWGNDKYYQSDDDLLEFQARLKSDGSIRYSYEHGSWTSMAQIGLKDAGNKQTFDYNPGSSSPDVIELVPTPWVSVTPSAGTLAAYGGESALTITADAAGQLPGTYEFALNVDWVDESDLVTTVKLEVINGAVIELPEEKTADFRASTNLVFSGPSDSISVTNLIVSNLGEVDLNYSIVEQSTNSVAFVPAVQDQYRWTSGFDALGRSLREDELETRVFDLGFPFIYKGTVYTNLTVGKGSIFLGDEEEIAPVAGFWGMDDDSEIYVEFDAQRTYFAVSYKNLSLPHQPLDQIFQLVLNNKHEIRVNAKRVDDSSVEFRLHGDSLQRITYDVGGIVIDGFEGDFPESQAIATNVATSLTETSIVFDPVNSRVFHYSPTHGTLAVGDTAMIEIKADTRGIDSVTNKTTLAFYSESVSDDVQSLVSETDEYEWTRSGKNNNLWYLTAKGGKNPNLLMPRAVRIENEWCAQEALPSLSKNRWGWGNIDSGKIDFNTIYVSLNDSSWDPDKRPAGYIQKAPISAPGVNVEVTFTIVPDAPATPSADQKKAMWGVDEALVSSEIHADGSRTLSWPAAQDDLNRTYTVWSTTGLDQPWQKVEMLRNQTTYVVQPSDEPVVFYKVTVQ